MSVKFSLPVLDIEKLNHIVKYDRDWRVRERAQTILLLSSGMNVSQAAREMKLSRPTVESTRQEWLRCQFDCLPDKPRTGAPRKIKKHEMGRLLISADARPMTAVDILKEHLENKGEPVHVATIRTMLKTNGRTWKRTRHSLKAKRNASAFAVATQEIQALLAQAATGDIVVGYLDETGMACMHPNRSAWTKIGCQHLIPAVRGKRLNVLGSLMSSGELEDKMFTGAMTSKILIEFLDEIAEKYDKPVTLILDNASFHKSKEVKQKEIEWAQKGLTLKFLPPYSPELNRIEKLWHTIKHSWMEAKHRTFDVLVNDVTHILENFGKKFKFNFYAK
ncbi:MAG: IS630 family transposase [Polaromonas sp.]